jgi:transcriptional regulator with XRE-family HTH domain
VVSEVDQAAEVRSLAGQNVSQREIARRTGLSRYMVGRLLEGQDEPPVADRPTTGTEMAARMAEVAEPVDRPPAAVAELTGRPAAAVAEVAEPGPDDLDARPSGPWLRLNLARRPRLLRALMTLLHLGMKAPVAVDVAVRAFAHAYHQAVIHGELRPGEAYEVQTRVRPVRCRQRTA